MLERMEVPDSSVPAEGAGIDAASDGPGGFGSLGSLIYLLLLSWGAFLALLPLNDNSFFTHVATGRIILEDGSVPSSDPYTFTALGEPWTVQSWLASVAYASAERAGGVFGLRALLVVLFVLATTMVWRLTRPAQAIVARLLVATAAMVVCSGVWSERPYMVAFIGLAVLWLALEGDVRPWLIVPLMWLWANSHGSYPLAIGLCLAVLCGELIDQRRAGDRVGIRREVTVLAAVIAGVALSVLSPLGLRAVTFPIDAVSRSATFRLIVEWQSPEFTSTAERAFLVLVLGGIAAVVTTRRWRHVLPLLAFVAAGLLARRNVVMAVPVLVPVIASAAPIIGTLRSRTRPALGVPVALVACAMFVLVLLSGRQTPLGLGGYPTRALSYASTDEPSGQLITQDFTGNLLEVLDGPTGAVYVDDRADMFPTEVLEDYRTLNTASLGWDSVLDQVEAQVVIWKRDHPLSTALAADPRWRIEFSDAAWVLAKRR